jgi:hypothetical protein
MSTQISTDQKFESRFRVPPPVLSTGFSVLIPLEWAQMSPHPPLAAASDPLQTRSGPWGQTERTHRALVGGPNTELE